MEVLRQGIALYFEEKTSQLPSRGVHPSTTSGDLDLPRALTSHPQVGLHPGGHMCRCSQGFAGHAASPSSLE